MLFLHNLSNPLPCSGCKALHRVTNSKKIERRLIHFVFEKQSQINDILYLPTYLNVREKPKVDEAPSLK